MIYQDLSQIRREYPRKLVYTPRERLASVTGQTVMLHDQLIKASSCDYEHDLKSTWVTLSRWGSLIRQYVDPEALDYWLDLIETRLQGGGAGQSFMRTNRVERRSPKTGREQRRWGACILGFGFRMKPRPHLTMYSRTTYFGGVGELDLALAHVLARELGERLGLKPGDIGFSWFIGSAQFHGMRSFSWWFGPEQGEDLKRLYTHKATPELRERAPGLYKAVHELNKQRTRDEKGLLYADDAYAQLVRTRRRYHTEVHGVEYGKQFEGGSRLKSSGMAQAAEPLPSVPVTSLTLEPLRTVKKEGSGEANWIGEEDVELFN